MRHVALLMMLSATVLVTSCADPCATSRDCAANEYCSFGGVAPQCDPDGTCHREGVCEDKLAEGERCDEPDSCVSGLECAGSCRVPPPPSSSDFMMCDAAGPEAVGTATLLFVLIGILGVAVSRRRRARPDGVSG